MTERPWWQGAVVYQIYPRSYCLAGPAGRRERLGLTASASPDRLRDGAGDLEGVRRHLDHVARLGADAVWLSPVYPSPMADFGYDVSDYTSIAPLFGDLDGFDALVAEAHERGIRVLLDWVPNHTSDQHPWFLDARSSRASEHRDWYVWREPDLKDRSKPPNNWKRAFGKGPAWTFDELTGQWYLHLFLPGQPDLNWSNPQVVDAMEGVLDFWLERGVDGFRIDVVHALGKPEGLGDVTDDQAELPYSVLNDDPATHPLLRRLRAHVDRWPHQPVLVGEVFLLDTAKVAKYYGDGDELHLAFNFRPMFTDYSAASFRSRLEEIERDLGPAKAWPTWVLSSHDRPRHRTRFGGSERRARAAAVLSLAMRGTVFLYAGEELGLEDAEVPTEEVVDPGGRDGCRAPIPWNATAEHGWALGGARPWLPFPPEASRLNVECEEADGSSMLTLYRTLTALRRSSPALRHGSLALLDHMPEEVLAFRRSSVPPDRDGAIVLVNFSDREVEIGSGGGEGGDYASWPVAASSGGQGALATTGELFAGRLGPDEAVVLHTRASHRS
ncbi:MAG: alpha-amylase family glycosyl hydrolase [Acidimicrobiales bacterium]